MQDTTQSSRPTSDDEAEKDLDQMLDSSPKRPII